MESKTRAKELAQKLEWFGREKVSETDIAEIASAFEQAEREARIEALCDENPEISKELEEAYIKRKSDNSFHLTWDALDVVKKSNYAEGFRAGKEAALKEWTKPFNDAYAEGFRAGEQAAILKTEAYQQGFRAGQEKLEEIRQSDLTESMKINDATSKECYQEGFRSGIEKEAVKCHEHCEKAWALGFNAAREKACKECQEKMK